MTPHALTPPNLNYAIDNRQSAIDNRIMDRKLTAILSADVEGYSRLMGEDEEATVRTLSTYREAMSRLIEEHKGHVIDSPGDNLLAEFTSAVNAVQCAVVIQGELRARNVALPEDRRMQYRIGINLGDVIVEGDRIYGDGVNIAARVESLAEGGGISISGTVYEHVANKLSYDFDDLGEHSVKNIAEPVRVYAVRWDVKKTSKQRDKPSKRGKWIAAVMIVAVFAVIGIGVVYWDKGKTLDKPTLDETIPLTLKEKPSIAVLPFRDMSPEKDQEYFCEGIAEELLNAFTKVAGLRVAARTSSFRFKDEAISTIGELLNVTTVLEGSVRKDGNNLRITAQLINVTDGFHLWSETYDRELKNIFAIQDEISQAIAQALHVTLTGEDGAPLVKAYTENIKAYEAYLLGRHLWNKRTPFWENKTEQFKRNAERLTAAIEHFEQAITLDPNYALAYSGLADVYLILPFYLPDINRDDVNAKVEEAVKKALALDSDLAEVHTTYGFTRWAYHGDYKDAERAYRRAIELNPKYAPAHDRYSNLFTITHRFEEALVEARKAYELEPFLIQYNMLLGFALTRARHYDAAIEQFQRTIELDTNYSMAWIWLGYAFFINERFEEAKNALVRWAEITGNDKEAVKLFVSLLEEHAHTGKPVYLPQEAINVWPDFLKTWCYALVGQKDKTLELLEQAYEMGWNIPLNGKEFDFLRSEPRFIELMHKREQKIKKIMMGLEE